MRDPFVVPCRDDGLYYLFGTTDRNCWEGPGTGFDFYTGRDLLSWDGPFTAFRPPPHFWAETNFWAPEVHRHRDTWFLFASFKKAGRPRGTQILTAPQLTGPYVPHTNEPVTPRGWECLDGSLFVAGDAAAPGRPGEPWLVFSREWTEIGDGEIWAMRLSDDLRQRAGEPVRLFTASSAPWTAPNEKGGYVSDGPFVRRMRSGKLLMLWSSRGRGARRRLPRRPSPEGYAPYALGLAVSDSGDITGPWRHVREPLFADDGGHGMYFEGLDGHSYVALHSPDDTPNERPHFLAVREAEDGLELEFPRHGPPRGPGRSPPT